MKTNKFYKCPKCNAILVITTENWAKTIRCTVCDCTMRLLNDDFALSEIITEEDK